MAFSQMLAVWLGCHGPKILGFITLFKKPTGQKDLGLNIAPFLAQIRRDVPVSDHNPTNSNN